MQFSLYRTVNLHLTRAEIQLQVSSYGNIRPWTSSLSVRIT